MAESESPPYKWTKRALFCLLTFSIISTSIIATFASVMYARRLTLNLIIFPTFPHLTPDMLKPLFHFLEENGVYLISLSVGFLVLDILAFIILLSFVDHPHAPCILTTAGLLHLLLACIHTRFLPFLYFEWIQLILSALIFGVINVLFRIQVFNTLVKQQQFKCQIISHCPEFVVQISKNYLTFHQICIYCIVALDFCFTIYLNCELTIGFVVDLYQFNRDPYLNYFDQKLFAPLFKTFEHGYSGNIIFLKLLKLSAIIQVVLLSAIQLAGQLFGILGVHKKQPVLVLVYAALLFFSTTFATEHYLDDSLVKDVLLSLGVFASIFDVWAAILLIIDNIRTEQEMENASLNGDVTTT